MAAFTGLEEGDMFQLELNESFPHISTYFRCFSVLLDSDQILGWRTGACMKHFHAEESADPTKVCTPARTLGKLGELLGPQASVLVLIFHLNSGNFCVRPVGMEGSSGPWGANCPFFLLLSGVRALC